MATINLLPNGSGINSFTLSSGSDVGALVVDDYTGTIAGDSNYLSATVINKVCYLTLDDFTEAHSSIDGVQLVLRAGNDSRTQTYDIETKLLGVGTYYTESTGTENSNRYYLTHGFTNRTTYDGSNAWTQALLNSLRARVDLHIHSGDTTKFTYCYVAVDYDLPVSADNSILFGTNF